MINDPLFYLIAVPVLLLTGIGVQASVWSLMPTWYHVTFLALVVPMTLLGSRLASARSRERAPVAA